MDLHTFIVENIEALLDDWAAFARMLPGCKDMSAGELREHAATLLRAIAAGINGSYAPGKQLATRCLGLNQLMAGFRALRVSVVRRWTASRGPASVEMLEQLVRFNEGIDQAIAESLARFVDEAKRRDDAESRRLREQEMRARRAEDRLHAALQEARMAWWEWDPEADRMTVSPTMNDLLELPPGERVLSSTDGFGLLHPEDAPDHQALVTEAGGNRKGWHSRFRIIRPCDGEVAWLEERAMPTTGLNGLVFITGLVWDITERKTAEEALKRNEQTFADLIERGPFGVYVADSQMRIFQMNHGSREGLFRNVRPALGSDLAGALRTIWPEPVAMDVLAAFRRTLDTGEPFVSRRFVSRRADVDATESYEWELHRIVLPDGQHGVVCYSFDSTQLRAAGGAPGALKEGGLGVGLALARGLIELHGGSLEAHSEGVGRGAEFVARLPLPTQTAVPEAPKMTEVPQPAGAVEAERVLVIDDNVDAADSLAELLRLRGHEVYTAHSGEEGIACAAAFRPNLVLLDLGMPRMDGYEVARRLRAMEGGAAFTLVAVSGWGQASDRRQTAAAGVDYHLTKPLEEGQLQPAFVEARRRKGAS